MEEKPFPVGNMHTGVACMFTCHAKTSEHGNEVTGAKIQPVLIYYTSTQIDNNFKLQYVGSKSSAHYLGDKNRFDVSSKGPSSAFARNVEASTKGLCSKRRICFYRLGIE